MQKANNTKSKQYKKQTIQRVKNANTKIKPHGK